jgi:hypothetical protein
MGSVSNKLVRRHDSLYRQVSRGKVGLGEVPVYKIILSISKAKLSLLGVLCISGDLY